MEQSISLVMALRISMHGLRLVSDQLFPQEEELTCYTSQALPE